MGVTGSLDASIGYDANGNVSSRAGQSFSFDVGNRLLSSSRGLSFAYDGHGRRTRVDYPGGDSRLQMFSSDGKLVYGKLCLLQMRRWWTGQANSLVAE